MKLKIFSGVQEIDCEKGDPFVIILVFALAFACISFFATAAFTIERVIVIAKPFQNHVQEHRKSIIILVIGSIILVSLGMYFPMFFERLPMHVNMETGTIAWDCPHAVYSMYISMAVANIVIVPSNIILVFKLQKENKLKRFDTFQ